MTTIGDFGQAVAEIREAVNSLEIKGRRSSTYVVFVNNKCDELLDAFNRIASDMENSAQNNAEEEEMDGDINEQDSGLSE